jgi:hypothetical protein
MRQHTSAYGAGVPVHTHLAPACSMRQHTSAYGAGVPVHIHLAPACSIRQHTSAYVSIRRRCPGTYPLGSCMQRREHECVGIRQHTSAYVSTRQHTSAHVSTRQHTSAYVSIRQHTSAYVTSAPACSDASISAQFVTDVSIRQHTSANTPAYVSIRKQTHHTCMQRREHERAIRVGRAPHHMPLIQHHSLPPHRQHVSIRQHTSAYVSKRQHASAYVSIRQHTRQQHTPPLSATTLTCHFTASSSLASLLCLAADEDGEFATPPCWC